ncbi:MipA/OmpV family protein [Polycladidibacter stylochi]|uniref:MipA/OmpV family protein n=1 Tax=Polycladidibacter stylochi TaxID=1807766 RepID=UPI00082C2150|nr:MipA/OmpV family protein [Pseudovibrio stylochi]
MSYYFKKELALIALGAFFILPPSASANDDFLTREMSDQQKEKQYVIDVGVAVFANPKYDGASDYDFTVDPLLGISRMYLPIFGQIDDDGDELNTFFLYPSFNFIDGRKPSDDDSLANTRKVNWAGEIGLGTGFRSGWFRAFTEFRKGFNGHTGWVGRAGIDIVGDVREDLTLSIGPRVDYADSEYMSTYFNTLGTDTSAGFDADAGFKSVGLVGRASYHMTNDMSWHLQVGYDRLLGDAKDSPVSENDDMFKVGVGATYRFDFNVFDQ